MGHNLESLIWEETGQMTAPRLGETDEGFRGRVLEEQPAEQKSRDGVG